MLNAKWSLTDQTGKMLKVHNQEEGTLGPEHQRNGFSKWKTKKLA